MAAFGSGLPESAGGAGLFRHRGFMHGEFGRVDDARHPDQRRAHPRAAHECRVFAATFNVGNSRVVDREVGLLLAQARDCDVVALALQETRYFSASQKRGLGVIGSCAAVGCAGGPLGLAAGLATGTAVAGVMAAHSYIAPVLRGHLARRRNGRGDSPPPVPSSPTGPPEPWSGRTAMPRGRAATPTRSTTPTEGRVSDPVQWDEDDNNDDDEAMAHVGAFKGIEGTPMFESHLAAAIERYLAPAFERCRGACVELGQMRLLVQARVRKRRRPDKGAPGEGVAKMESWACTPGGDAQRPSDDAGRGCAPFFLPSSPREVYVRAAAPQFGPRFTVADAAVRRLGVGGVINVDFSQGVVANKGGLISRLSLARIDDAPARDGREAPTMHLCFTAMHLPAHEGHKAQRNSALAQIMDHAAPLAQGAHAAFMLGDLNYRLDDPPAAGEARLAAAFEAAVEAGAWDTLVQFDELLHELAACNASLRGFSTPSCDFAPTFKVKRGERRKYNPKRLPAWCDRCLVRAAPGAGVDVLAYESVEDVLSSDHKPVVMVARVVADDFRLRHRALAPPRRPGHADRIMSSTVYRLPATQPLRTLAEIRAEAAAELGRISSRYDDRDLLRKPNADLLQRPSADVAGIL